jgi:hypothetical protein
MEKIWRKSEIPFHSMPSGWIPNLLKNNDFGIFPKQDDLVSFLLFIEA